MKKKNLDYKKIEKHINGKTKAIIVTHLNGKPAKINDIYKKE